MDLTKRSALELSWQEVCRIISEEIEKNLGISIQCKANVMEDEFWDIEFVGYRLPLPKLCQLLQAMDATLEDWENALPDEGGIDINDIGIPLTEKLIAQNLGLTWEHQVIAKDGLWLVGVKDTEAPKLEQDASTLPTELVQAFSKIAEYFHSQEGRENVNRGAQ